MQSQQILEVIGKYIGKVNNGIIEGPGKTYSSKGTAVSTQRAKMQEENQEQGQKHLCLNTDPVAHKKREKRVTEVLCLNTDLQLTATHGRKRPQQVRKGARARRKAKARRRHGDARST